jgi:hypothetical protein
VKTSMLVMRRKVAFGIAASSFFISDRAVLAAAIAAIKALKPGEFISRPEVSPRGPVVIVVSLPEPTRPRLPQWCDDRRLHVLGGETGQSHAAPAGPAHSPLRRSSRTSSRSVHAKEAGRVAAERLRGVAGDPVHGNRRGVPLLRGSGKSWHTSCCTRR